MKESTGELSMTVITIVAIVAIGGFITAFWPKVEEWINGQWGNLSGETTSYVEVMEENYNL